MAQAVGIIDVVWKGVKIPTEKGATFNPGGMQNNAVVVGRQVHRSQEFMASAVKFTTVLLAGQRLTDVIGNGQEGEMQVKCDTGQTFLIPDAFLTKKPDVTGGEGGKIALEFAGSEALEIS